MILSLQMDSVLGGVTCHAVVDTDHVRHVPDAPEATDYHIVITYTWYTCGVTN